MISPTPGRIVWFHPTNSPHDRLGMFGTGEPLAAIVARVWSDTMVNLAVFDPNGEAHSRTSIYLKQDGGREPSPGEPYAEWMPYQKGQAAKYYALERVATKATVAL